uniref:Uncharacterized protein n=1 Tax=Sphaerodactylus townsendi TaxID=933632 RepID=A0ACB8GEB5_9SAUR
MSDCEDLEKSSQCDIIPLTSKENMDAVSHAITMKETIANIDNIDNSQTTVPDAVNTHKLCHLVASVLARKGIRLACVFNKVNITPLIYKSKTDNVNLPPDSGSCVETINKLLSINSDMSDAQATGDAISKDLNTVTPIENGIIDPSVKEFSNLLQNIVQWDLTTQPETSEINLPPSEDSGQLLINIEVPSNPTRKCNDCLMCVQPSPSQPGYLVTTLLNITWVN